MLRKQQVATNDLYLYEITTQKATIVAGQKATIFPAQKTT